MVNLIVMVGGCLVTDCQPGIIKMECTDIKAQLVVYLYMEVRSQLVYTVSDFFFFLKIFIVH
jgi:hypothetical protein